MEEYNSARFEVIGNTIRKKRSRRPRPESQSISDGRDISSLSSTPPSDDMKAASSDGDSGVDLTSKKKELSLSQCVSKFPGASGVDNEKPVKKSKKLDIGLNELYVNSPLIDYVDQGWSSFNYKRSSEGIVAPTNRKSTISAKESLEPQKNMALNRKVDESAGASQDGLGNDIKVRKVKLKVGGVTCTIDANSKRSRALHASVSGQKLAQRDNPETDNSLHGDKKSGLQAIPWKDFSKVGFTLGRDGSSMKGDGRNSSEKHNDRSDLARKSKRAPKKIEVDGNDDDDDVEIRYLEKLKKPKYCTGFGEDEDESSRKHRRLSEFPGNVTPNIEGGASS